MARFSPDHWMLLPPRLETHEAVRVLREDLIEGGSKIRFLPFLTQGADEIVFGGPFCGGAPLALSVLGKQTGQKITLFYAKRKNLHPRQIQARRNGATIKWVPMGFMTNVQAKARAYAKRKGALFLHLGFDVPRAQEPYVEFFTKVRKKIGSPDQVWCATGSGMLTRCLGLAFTSSEVHGVTVGLASRHTEQKFTRNIHLHETPYRFDQRCEIDAPFPACFHYERKAWEVCQTKGKGSRLFINVLGE